MSETDWMSIPGRLRSDGFEVHFDRVSYDPENPQWCATAVRRGREWRCLGATLATALRDLEIQTHEIADDWRKIHLQAKEPEPPGSAALGKP